MEKGMIKLCRMLLLCGIVFLSVPGVFTSAEEREEDELLYFNTVENICPEESFVVHLRGTNQKYIKKKRTVTRSGKGKVKIQKLSVRKWRVFGVKPGKCKIVVRDKFQKVSMRVNVYHHYFSEATCTEPSRCMHCGKLGEEALGHDFIDTVVEPCRDSDGYTEHVCSRCGYVHRDSFTYFFTDENWLRQQVYGFQAKYPQGTPWGMEKVWYNSCGCYRSPTECRACLAFAMMINDTIYGKEREYYKKGPFATAEEWKNCGVRAGDVLHYYNSLPDSGHAVAVIQKTETGIIICEGNSGGKVRWGRELTYDFLVERNGMYYIRENR